MAAAAATLTRRWLIAGTSAPVQGTCSVTGAEVVVTWSRALRLLLDDSFTAVLHAACSAQWRIEDDLTGGHGWKQARTLCGTTGCTLQSLRARVIREESA